MYVKAMLAKNNGGLTWMWFKALWLNITVGETPWNRLFSDAVVQLPSFYVDIPPPLFVPPLLHLVNVYLNPFSAIEWED